MSIQYVQRAIDVQLALGQGDFGEIAPTGSNVVTLTGLRVSANISKVGAPGFCTAEIRIWGLTETVMNAVSALGKPIQYDRINTVTLTAGDVGQPLAQVFHGIIQNAYQDFSDAGAASLNISSITSLIDQTKPANPTSFPGSADVATIMSGLANQMNLAFTNYGVTAQLSAPYFWGTARAQAAACAKAANIYWVIDDTTLAIWPKTGVRGGQVPLISPTTGLVGYPRWSSAGVMLKTLYNPNLLIGAGIVLDTSIVRARGNWRIMSLSHSLEAQMPGGEWFSDMECYRVTADGF